jgi:peptidyl-prolyl cis-trans isomerase A (cyclophilin A)
MFTTTKKDSYKEEAEFIWAEFHTSLGMFKAKFFAKECPETVWNFINLAEGRQKTSREGKFYDGLNFHRVIKGFMIQGGCPEGSGRGGPGYRFQDECRADLKHDKPGIFSMANAGPGTNGSQFFITLAPTPHLNGRHTVFGYVESGMDVVEKIGATKTDFSDKPITPVVIEKVVVLRA